MAVPSRNDGTWRRHDASPLAYAAVYCDAADHLCADGWTVINYPTHGQRRNRPPGPRRHRGLRARVRGGPTPTRTPAFEHRGHGRDTAAVEGLDDHRTCPDDPGRFHNLLET